MKRTVPSRPLSPIRPERGDLPFGAVEDVGVGGGFGVLASLGDTSLGEGFVPFDGRLPLLLLLLPFVTGFDFFDS